MFTIGRAELVEGSLGFEAASGPDRAEYIGPMLGQLRQRGAAVGRIRPARDQAPAFERVDDLGCRPRRDVQPVRQRRHVQGTVMAQDPQSAKLRRRDVPRRQSVLRRVPKLPRDRTERLRQRLLAARVAPARVTATRVTATRVAPARVTAARLAARPTGAPPHRNLTGTSPE